MNKVVEENDSQGNTTNSDNINDNNKRQKRTRNRPCKNERYENERKELIKELERLMGLSEGVRGVLLYDLEHNEELKSYLIEKVHEIKKMFKCGTWNYFVKQHNKDVSEIGLLKSIFKNEKYELSNRRRLTEREGVKKIYIEICFNSI
jgi:hypothetical protein